MRAREPGEDECSMSTHGMVDAARLRNLQTMKRNTTLRRLESKHVTVRRDWLLEFIAEVEERLPSSRGGAGLPSFKLITDASAQQGGNEVTFPRESLTEVMAALPPAALERIRGCMGVTANVSAVMSGILDDVAVRRQALSMRTRANEALDEFLSKREADEREQAIEMLARAHTYLVAQHDARVQGATKIAAAFRGWKQRRINAGTWAVGFNLQVAARADARARYLDYIRLKPQLVGGKEHARHVSEGLRDAEDAVTRMESRIKTQVASGAESPMRLPRGGKSQEYRLDDPQYRRQILGDKFVNEEEAELRREAARPLAASLPLSRHGVAPRSICSSWSPILNLARAVIRAALFSPKLKRAGGSLSLPAIHRM
ncbi:hypothetical protein FOA52_004222 [Chlamydomonas sp. UWO 241]|nr:hypothetical protein FOA52_004222 [Chlamydomonas sp. UWO 241]